MIQTGAYFSLTWLSFTLVLLVSHPDADYEKRHALTVLCLVGGFVAFIIGWALMYARLAWSKRQFTAPFTEVYPRFEYLNARSVKFLDAMEVEICARYYRHVINCISPVECEQFIETADAIFKKGLEKYPESARLHLAYMLFTFSVKGNLKGGTALLSKVRKLKYVCIRFSLLSTMVLLLFSPLCLPSLHFDINVMTSP